LLWFADVTLHSIRWESFDGCCQAGTLLRSHVVSPGCGGGEGSVLFLRGGGAPPSGAHSFAVA